MYNAGRHDNNMRISKCLEIVPKSTCWCGGGGGYRIQGNDEYG